MILDDWNGNKNKTSKKKKKEHAEIFCKGAKLTKRKYSANVDLGYLHDKHPESQIIIFLKKVKTNV